MPVLGRWITPVRRDRADEHTVTGLEDLDRAADLVHDTNRLMSEREVLARTDAAVNSMGIRGADQRPGRLDDGVIRTRSWVGLVHKPDVPDLLRNEALHVLLPPTAPSPWRPRYRTTFG